jgi:hypothetical protein
MKWIAIPLFTLFSLSCLAQQPLSKESINSFAKAAYNAYRWEMYGFKNMVMRHYIYVLDKSAADAAVAIESISKDPVSRENIFASFDMQLIIIKDVCFNYLYKLGMDATSAKEVSEYIHIKYVQARKQK